MSNIYKQAAQQKLRFESKRCLLTSEDLFTLPISKGEISLRNLAIAVNKKLTKSDTEIPDFLSDEASAQTKEQQLLQLQFDILKDVIETRKEENQQSTEAYKRDQERAAIRELIAKKKQQNLEDLSIDELEAKLKNIG